MTIDVTNNNIVIYPRQDVKVARGHVDRMKDRFLNGAVQLEKNSRQTRAIETEVNVPSLQRGKVREIASLWGAVKEHQYSAVNPIAQKEKVCSTSSYTKQIAKQEPSKAQKRRRRWRRKSQAAKNPLPAPFQQDKTVSSQKNNTEKLESVKPIHLTEIETNEVQWAYERIEAIVHAYHQYFWPPKVKGVFRVSPCSKDLENLEAEVKKMSSTELNDMFSKAIKNKGCSEHLLAGLMKKILRDLSTSAIPSKFYHECLSIANSSENKRLEQLKKLIQMIAPIHKMLLGALMTFLNKLSDHEKETSMGIDNLAIVIAPNILVAPEETPLKQLVEDLNRATTVVAFMIKNANEFASE